MKKFFILVGAAVAVLLILASARWNLSQWKDVFVMPFHKDERTVEITLQNGEPLRKFAAELEEKRIIVSHSNFLYWLARKDADRALKAGTYSFSSGPSWYVAEQLTKASPLYVSATILPGAFPDKPLPLGTPEQQRAELDNLNNYPEAMRPLLPDSAEARAAFLLPETYMLVKESLPELVKKASAAWFERFGSVVKDKEAALRAAVIASLLQKEAQVPEEYAVIAGVIENRLRRGMNLQIDASAVYAWYRSTGEVLRRVLYKHLAIDSPYNTYKYPGLPPAPICVPSSAAWEGALAPEENDYLFYVSTGDGRHQFAKDHKEHAKNVAEYRKKK
ncbi:MAG: endolytic transglycosylase MltG [Pyramidobacter sp.]